MKLIVENLPWPPSDNDLTKPFTLKGQPFARLIKTKEARAYEDHILAWAITNKGKVKEIREIIKSNLKDERTFLRIHYFFGMEESDIFTKAGHARRFDCPNFLKALNDGLVGIFGVDDSRFEIGDCRKVITEPSIGRRLSVVLEYSKVEAYDDLIRKHYNESP